MKKMIIVALAFVSLLSFANAKATDELLYKGVSLSQASVAEAAFEEMKSVEIDGSKLSICYIGNGKKAVKAVNKLLKIELIDIYANGILEVEVSHVDGRVAYGLITVCE